LKSDILNVWMQALDSFISPIPGFEGDIPIPAMPISARSPSGESANDPSARASAGASKTHAGKRNAFANPIPHKKAKKAMGKSTGGIKINKPATKASLADSFIRISKEDSDPSTEQGFLIHL
jgi:hypothetical protein